MTLLLGALTIGLILSLLAMGIYVSFRVFDIADITVDGSITLGAALCAVLLVRGTNPIVAMLASFAAGCAAGTVTGILQSRFKINPLLSGVLVMTALYSVNLHIMGRSNIPLLSANSVTTMAERWALAWTGGGDVDLLGWMVAGKDVAVLVMMCGIVVAVGLALYWFLRTEVGTAMRAAGDNPQMIRALGVNVGTYRIMGLALSNGLVAWSGALLAQYQGFADAQMGIGMIVWGLASVIIGESLTGSRSLGVAIYGAVAGSVLFRLLVAMALRWGLNPNDLKIVTAIFVFVALVLPGLVATRRKARSAGAATGI